MKLDADDQQKELEQTAAELKAILDGPRYDCKKIKRDIEWGAIGSTYYQVSR